MNHAGRPREVASIFGATKEVFMSESRETVGVLVTLVMALGFVTIVFLICRAIVLWYFRINEALVLLKSIDEKLGRMTTREPYVK